MSVLNTGATTCTDALPLTGHFVDSLLSGGAALGERQLSHVIKFHTLSLPLAIPQPSLLILVHQLPSHIFP